METEDMTEKEMAEELAKELSKYNMKINGMFDAALNGKLHASMYVALMHKASELWLEEMKRKIVESDDKEELDTYNECLEMINGAVSAGALKMCDTNPFE